MKKITASLLLALVVGACAKHEQEAAAPSAVEIAPVREVSSGAGVRYSATVEPDVQTTVAFRIGGYVEGIAVQEGDRVAKGTVLARIRRSDYAEKYGQAQAQHAQAQASLVQAKTDLDRSKKLFEANAMTKPELDAAIAKFDMTAAQVSGGKAAASEAGLSLSDTTLVSPISGVVLRKNIERGDLTGPSTAAFVIGDTRMVKVVFGVPDTMIRSCHIGQTIEVATESIPDHSFTGTIARIAPAADPKARNFDIELKIDNPKNELKPGMVASLEISKGGSQMLAVPLAAVVRPPKASEGYAVFVVTDNKAQARVVELGEPIGNLVAVRSGLKSGEHVVVSGPALLVDGQTVREIGGSL